MLLLRERRSACESITEGFEQEMLRDPSRRRDFEEMVDAVAREFEDDMTPSSLRVWLAGVRSAELAHQVEAAERATKVQRAQWAQEVEEQAQRRKEQQQRDEESRAARTEQNRARQLEIEERRRRREAADTRLQALLSHRAWDSSHILARFDVPEGAQAELNELRAVADEKLVARVEARLHRTVRRVSAHTVVGDRPPFAYGSANACAGEARQGSRTRVG